MRGRLLTALLVAALVFSVGLAVPLLLATSAQRGTAFAAQRQHDLSWFAALAMDRSLAGQRRIAAEMRRYTEVYGDGLVLLDSRGRQLSATGTAAAGRPDIAAAAAIALRSQQILPPTHIMPWSTGAVLFAQSVGGPSEVTGAVVLEASVVVAASDVLALWIAVISGVVTAAGFFAFLAVIVANWVLRPLHELRDAAEKLTAGSRTAYVAGETGPPEIRRLAGCFNRMSEALAESAQRQRDLVADASHQLRNPMAALRLRFDAVAANRTGSAADQQATLTAAAVELARMEALLDGLLMLARADGVVAERRTAPATARCYGLAVLAERVEAWRYSAAAAGVDLALAADCWDGEVAAADLDLGQILDILLDNAVRYAGRGSVVEAGVQRRDGLAQFTVSDTGPGLTAVELRHAGRRFWRSVTAPGGGNGLGLAIAGQLARANGGDMTLHPHRPSGLTVAVRLRLVDTRR